MPRLHSRWRRRLSSLAALVTCWAWLSAELAAQQPSFLPSGSRTRAGGIDRLPEAAFAPVKTVGTADALPSAEAGEASCTDLPATHPARPAPSDAESLPFPPAVAKNTGLGEWQEGKGVLKTAMQEFHAGIAAKKQGITGAAGQSFEGSHLRILNPPSPPGENPLATVEHVPVNSLNWPNTSADQHPGARLQHALKDELNASRGPHPPGEATVAGYAEAVAPSGLKGSLGNLLPAEPLAETIRKGGQSPYVPQEDEPRQARTGSQSPSSDDRSGYLQTALPAESSLADPARCPVQVPQHQIPVVQLPPYKWEHLYPSRDSLSEAPPWTGGETAQTRPSGNGDKDLVQAPQGNGPSGLGSPVGVLGAGAVVAGPDGYYPAEPPAGAGMRREPFVPLPMEGYAVGSSHRYPTAANQATGGVGPVAYGRSSGLGAPAFGGTGLGGYGASGVPGSGAAAPLSAGFGLPGDARGRMR